MRKRTIPTLQTRVCSPLDFRTSKSLADWYHCFIGNTNKRTSIEIQTFTYNPLRFKHVSIFYRSSSGSLHHTSTYKIFLNYQISLWCKLPEDDLQKIEISCSISGLHVKVCMLILGYLLVLSLKLSLMHGYGYC
jgi:hypothetical protein